MQRFLSQRCWFWLTLAALLVLMPGLHPYAQDLGNDSGNGSDLLDIFRNMSSSQQQQILNRLGGGGQSGRSGAQQGNFGQQRNQAENEAENRRPRENEEAQPRIPLFKGEDYV